MLELGVIADDLTGGVKVASLLEAAGVRCPLVTSVAALDGLGDDSQAVVVGRKLLALPAHEAVADAKRSGEALLAKGAKQLYYKYSALFSSTARGNIGPVSEALAELARTDRVLFCPARPDRNATVYQGRLFLGRQMLNETPRRNDPVTPMTNANLVEVLQSQSRFKVGLLEHRNMRAGRAACEDALAAGRAAGERFFIVDVIDAADLSLVAALAEGARLVTGSDDLPVALAQRWPTAAGNRDAATSVGGRPGSCRRYSPEAARRGPRSNWRGSKHAIPSTGSTWWTAAGDEGLVDRIVDWARERMTHGPLAVATTDDADSVRRAQAALGAHRASALADSVLGTVAQRLHALGVRKFVIAGGETSGAVMAALGVDRVDVGAYDELEGGLCQTTGSDTLTLVLKGWQRRAG